MKMTRRELLPMISSLVSYGVFANIQEVIKTRRISNRNKLPAGVLTAVLTPLNKKLNADNAELINHINWLLKRGNDGIGLLGSTGEANSFSVDERLQILEGVLDGGIPSNKLLIGTGCCAITDTATLTRHAHLHGVGGILLLPPFYYKKINDLGLESYVDDLLNRVGENDVEIYLYHFPQLSGVSFSLKLVERLVSKYPKNIIGMKDSGGDWTHMETILKEIPNFRLYTGNEKFLLPLLESGGQGCISGNANFTSPEIAAVYNAWKKAGGEKEQVRVTQLRDVFDTYPAIGTLKYLYAKWSGNADWLNVRPPNVILTSEEGLIIEQKLQEINYSNPF